MSTGLEAVGFWTLVGYSLSDIDAWRAAELPVAEASSWNLDQLADGLRGEAVELVDVRELNEWATGHIRGSHHVPLHRLRQVSSTGLPQTGRTIAVACAAGPRAAFAASLLRRAGRRDVVRMPAAAYPTSALRGLELEPGLL